MNEETGVNDTEGDNKEPDESIAAAERDKVNGLQQALAAERSKRQSIEQSLAKLEGKLEGLSTGQQQTQEREYTRPELRRAVDNGEISEDEADEIYDRQSRARQKREIEQEVDARFTQTTTMKAAQDEVNKYLTAVPEAEDPDSKEFKAVKAEFDYLVSIGNDPNAIQTQAAALRAAFGDTAKRVKGEKSLQTFQDTGSAGSSDSEGGTKIEGLSNDQKAFYKSQIDKGRYSGWDDENLQSEIEYVKARKAA